VQGTRLAAPDWLSEAVPDWLAEVMRPKKAPVPWADMVRAVFAIWVPLAAEFITGRRELVLLPAMGGLLSVMIDTGGPYIRRVRRIGTAAVFGGAAGLVAGSLIHGRGWIADAIQARIPPPPPGELPADPALVPVTEAVRSVLGVLTRGEPRAHGEARAPAPA
jgi:hypothetical protein